ncbi:MAG: phosphatase PAP2 family protein [Clostridia bacterium]
MDIAYLLALQNFREATGGLLDQFFLLCSKLGDATIMAAISALVLWCGNRKTSQFIMLSAAGSLLLNQAIKITACVYRPWVRDARIVPLEGARKGATGYSFPSGHAANATALWGGLALAHRKRRWLCAGCVLLMVLVSFSRNYVGVHTPQDVLVSLALGGLLLVGIGRVCAWLDADAARAKARSYIVFGVGMGVGAALLGYALVKPYPMDYVNGQLLVAPAKMVIDTYKAVGSCWGIFIGWLWEKRAIHFAPEGTVLTRVVRSVVGIALLLGVNEGAEALFAGLGESWCGLIASGLSTLFATAIYPLIFTKVENALHQRAPRRAR